MIGFFDLCFVCNIRTTYYECEECRYEEVCDKFQMCFAHCPSEVWRKVSSFEDILKCVEKWRLYNEQTIEQ